MAELFAPVFDLAFQHGDPSHRQTIVNQVMDACKTYGMFKIQDHRISEAVLADAMASAKEFFTLPSEQMRLFSGISNSKCMLYTSSYAHALGLAEPPFYWRDALQLKFNTEVVADGWPTLPDSFRPKVWEFATSAALVEEKVLSMICEGLGLDENYFNRGLCEAAHIVVDHYPRCPKPTCTVGMPRHCDAGVLTISLQRDVPGTQIYLNGEWLTVEPPSMNNLLVTVGHQLQVISNGAFKVPIHREVVNSEKARTTISRVSEPSGDCVVGPAGELTTTDPPRYKSFKYEEYLEHYVREYTDTCSILERYYMSS